MGKELLKENIKRRQNGRSAVNPNVRLPEEKSLWDTDRIVPKAQGGIYTEENTRGLTPKEHQIRHNNLREREPRLSNLKTLIDARKQLMKMKVSSTNRLTAYERNVDVLDEPTIESLKLLSKEAGKHLAKLDRRIEKELKDLNDPLANSALGVFGVGKITVAFMLVYVDLTICEYASSLWAYVGITAPSHKRYTKGETSGGNKTLRTVLYTTAESLMKRTESPYRQIYLNEKKKLEVSKRIVETCNTQGKWVECMWKDTKPSHRHGAALRKVMKHFLADWWVVGRTLAGLPTPKLYVEEHLGHTDIIKPEERGWKY